MATAVTATILVSDLVGSTELRAALGEERAEEVRRRHDVALIDAAERSGGTVVKGLGDGLLVQFAGAAEAVAAAVAMQQAVDALARRERLDLAARIGVSSGDVTLEDGDCFGLPVVEASRLCAAAGDGEIYAADVITVLTRGRGGHTFEPVGDLDLKGIPDPVPTVRVAWEPVRTWADLRTTTPYVGRDRERALLRERFDAAATGAGDLVLVAGEPGIGKTRLVSELCAELRLDGRATVLWGGCHDGEVTAFAPFVAAFGDWLRATPTVEVAEVLGRDAAVLGRLVPAVHDALPDTGQPADLPPEDADARLHAAVTQVLARLAATRPVVVVLDDLHWADGATVALLRAVARAAGTLPVLVVGTYRDTDLGRGHPLAAALPVLRREVEPTRFALDGLSVADVRDLLERIAEQEVPEAFAALLADQTDGNPFFLREMLLHLVEVGALRFEDGGWVAADDLASVIPEGVREVIGRRISQLGEPAQRLLAVGSLFEVGFPLTVAAEVAGLDEHDALDAIDEALDAQVVVATETFDHFAFTHALFRQTLAAEANPSRQVRTHRAIAEALDKRVRGEPTPAEAAALVRHWHLSAALPGAERGVPAAVALARDATSRFAHAEAYEALSIAVELLADGDERTAELLLARAEAGIRAHVDGQAAPGDDLSRVDVVADATAALELIAADEGADAAADAAARVVANAMVAGNRPPGWAIAAVGRRFLDPTRRDVTWLHLRGAELAEEEYHDPDHAGLPVDDEARRELQEEWERLFLDGVDLGGTVFLASSRAVALAALERDEHGNRLRGDRQDGSLGAAWAAWVAGEVHTMMEVVRELLAGPVDPVREAFAGVFLARGLTVVGEHDEADATLAGLLAGLDRLPPASNAVLQVLAVPALAGYVRGQPPPAADLAGLDAMAANPDSRWVSLAIEASAAVAAARDGDAERALELVGRCMVGIERAPGYVGNYVLIASLCAEALWVVDRRDHVASLERNLVDKVITPDLRYLEVVPQLAAARLAALAGRLDDARRWVAAAYDVIAAQGTSPMLAPVHEFEAELELRLGADGDPERFRAALAAGRAVAAHPAMAPWLDRYAALEAAAPAGWT